MGNSPTQPAPFPPVQSATLYAIQDIPDILPARADGKRTHPATVWRWVTRGVRGRKLATQMIGGRRFITGQALLEFLGGGEKLRPETSRAVRVAAARKRLREEHGF